MGDAITDKGKAGHSERLRKRFLAGEGSSYSDEALLELLLTYVIPQKDVQPLAKQLIAKYGSLDKFFSADMDTPYSVNGIEGLL